MDIFFFQIAIIFIPGIIWARIDAQYGMRTRPSQADFLITTLMYGLISYAATYIIYDALGWDFSPLELESKETKTLFVKDWADEILFSAPIALILSIIWLYITNFKIGVWLLQGIGATKTYGDEDVWDFTLNSKDPSVEYVHFRDFDNGYIYAGWVTTFSESGQLRELLLRDVVVFTLETAEELYRTPHLYIARNKDNILIEFPYTEKKEQK